MKKLPFLAIFLFFTLIFVNCTKQQTLELFTPIPTNIESVLLSPSQLALVAQAPTKINFTKLAVGQQSIYIKWNIERIYDAANTKFTQTQETLSLTVVSKNAKGFKIEEKQLIGGVPSVFYNFRVQGDSIFVEKISNALSLNSVLFNFKANKIAFLLKDAGLSTWALNRWAVPTNFNQTSLVEFGKVQNFTIMGTLYNKAIGYYNGQDSVFDGFTRVVLYTVKDGFICFHAFGGRAGTGASYQLIN
jgi:hypothetical protein